MDVGLAPERDAPVQELLKARHLLGAVESHQLWRHRALMPGQPAPGVARQQREAANQVGSLSQLEGAARKLPQWVAAQEVVLLPIVEACLQLAAASGTHLSMVLE